MGPKWAQHGLKIEVRGLSKALLDRSWRRGRFGDRFRPSFRLENRAEMHGKKCALHALSASVFAPLTGAKKRSCRAGVCFFARCLASSLRGFVHLVTHFSGYKYIYIYILEWTRALNARSKLVSGEVAAAIVDSKDLLSVC